MSNNNTLGLFLLLFGTSLALNLCRCLAHIINLATQSLILTRSKSKYFSGDPNDDNLLEDLGSSEHDEIGLVHSICVKVSHLRSSHLITPLISNVNTGMFICSM
jgi:hypothetical protein